MAASSWGRIRFVLLAGVAALALGGCAANRAGAPDYSAMGHAESADAVAYLTERYRANPRDKGLVVHYAAALRAQGQSAQAAIVLETGMAHFPADEEISIAYAKALTAEGRFEQALNVIDNAIRPQAPHWEALSVKGAVLDQMGRNAEARRLYIQALAVAPGRAALEANLGLSYAMINELDAAEHHLRRAVGMEGSTSRIRQNLALVLGLQGRFSEAEALYAAELPPAEVEANMASLRAMLGGRNRWDMIAAGG